jgi:carbon starvation protein CstA
VADYFQECSENNKLLFFNTPLSVLLVYRLAYNNAVLVIWPIFGSANQLPASLALIAVSVSLINRKKTAWFTILSAISMSEKII